MFERSGLPVVYGLRVLDGHSSAPFKWDEDEKDE